MMSSDRDKLGQEKREFQIGGRISFSDLVRCLQRLCDFGRRHMLLFFTQKSYYCILFKILILKQNLPPPHKTDIKMYFINSMANMF